MSSHSPIYGRCRQRADPRDQRPSEDAGAATTIVALFIYQRRVACPRPAPGASVVDRRLPAERSRGGRPRGHRRSGNLDIRVREERAATVMSDLVAALADCRLPEEIPGGRGHGRTPWAAAPTPPGTRRAAGVVSGPAASGGGRPNSRWIRSVERPTEDIGVAAPTLHSREGPPSSVRVAAGREHPIRQVDHRLADGDRRDAAAATRPSADAYMGRRHAVRPRSPASSITGSQADFSIGGRPVRDDRAAARPAPRSSCKTRCGEPGRDRDKPLRHEFRSARPPPSSRTRVPAIKPLAMIVPAETRAGHLEAVSAGRSALESLSRDPEDGDHRHRVRRPAFVAALAVRERDPAAVLRRPGRHPEPRRVATGIAIE